MSNKFHRGERLKSRKEIGRLFGKDGRSLSSYPLRLVHAEVEEVRGPFPFQAAFVVPKRRFKRAVDRNLIKRRVREAFRLNKELIGAHSPLAQRQYALMFIYTGKEAMPYKYIERKMRKLLGELAKQLAN
ncbi:MAG: ribonuclease P protein component [Bacteroidota bacterium]